MTHGIGLVYFAYDPIQNGQESAVSRTFGEQCELNMSHPLKPA